MKQNFIKGSGSLSANKNRNSRSGDLSRISILSVCHSVPMMSRVKDNFNF